MDLFWFLNTEKISGRSGITMNPDTFSIMHSCNLVVFVGCFACEYNLQCIQSTDTVIFHVIRSICKIVVVIDNSNLQNFGNDRY